MNNAGIVIKSVPVEVNEGSANANNIYLVAPFAANLSATVAFKLPDGIVTPQYGLTPTGEIPGFTDAKGNKYNGWSYALPNNITEKYGEVTAQFFFYSASSPVRVLASSATTFTVARGVAAILPDTPSEDVYEQILSTLAQIQSDLTNGYYTARAIYAWNSSYTYGANDLVYFPVPNGHGKFVKSVVNNNTQPPYELIDGVYVLQSNWQEVLDFDEVYALAQEAADVLDDAKEQAEIATQAAANATAAMNAAQSSASSASKSASNAANAANNAAMSAIDAAESARQAAEAVVNYYTKSEIDSGVGTSLDASMDTTTYIVTLTLKSKDGTTLSEASIDLPLESIIVDGTYDAATKEIVLTLHDGQEVRIPVADLVEGLATQEALDNVIDGTTPVAKALHADNADIAGLAGKVDNKLTVIVDGEATEYDGSTAENVIINTAGKEVGDGQITIIQNGETIGSFTVNQTTSTVIPFSSVRLSDEIPLMDGVASAGTSAEAAHADHVHESDNSKANKSELPGIEHDYVSTATTGYYYLGKLAVSNAASYASICLRGKIGGWKSNNIDNIVFTIGNRDGVRLSGMYTTASDGKWAENAIRAYTQSDGSVDIYLYLDTYIALNIVCTGQQATLAAPNNFSTSTPSGTAATIANDIVNTALPPAVKDVTTGTATTMNYGAADVVWSNTTYIAAWNGYELRGMNKAQLPFVEKTSKLTYTTIYGETELTSDTQSGTVTSPWSTFKYIAFRARNATGGSDSDGSWIFIPSNMFESIFNSANSPISISREGARLKLYRTSSTGFAITARNFNNYLTIWGVSES